MISEIEALCKLNAMFYLKNWLDSTIEADVPYNGLNLWRELIIFCRHDPLVINAAMKAMERHFWYLTEEFAEFSNFLNRLFSSEMQLIARTLLRISSCEDFENKMSYPTVPVLKNSTKFSSLNRPKSWFLFHSLEMGVDWLWKPMRKWQSDSNFKETDTQVRYVKVLNERAVKTNSRRLN